MQLDPRVTGEVGDLLAQCYRSSPKTKKSLDLAKRAVKLAAKQKNKLGRILALGFLGLEFTENGNPQSAITVLKEAEELCAILQETKILESILYQRGRCYTRLANYEQAEKIFKQALVMSEKEINNEGIIGSVLADLGWCSYYQGKYTESFEYANRAEALSANSSNEDVMRSAYFTRTLLGALYSETGDKKTGREYFEKNLLTAKERGTDPCQMLHNIGNNFAEEGEYEKSIEYQKEALKYMPTGRIKVYINISLAEDYIGLKKLHLAEKYADTALNVSGEEASNHELVSILALKGKIRFLRDESDADSFLLQAYKIAVSQGERVLEAEILLLLSQYYEKELRIEDALRNYQEWHSIIVSLNEDKLEAASNLKRKLEIEHHYQEKKILQLELEKNEILLTSQAIHLATQTELLGNFRNKLRIIVREIDEPIAALKKIKEELKTLPCESVDWHKFEEQFTSVHPEFRAKLIEKYPELTKQEIKMCQLTRLGLKVHEMAQLLCLSERSIESHRYNLRKKLGMKTEENLAKFLEKVL